MAPFIPKNFNPNIAYVTDSKGNVFQVLNNAGDDWDEAATMQQQAQFNAGTLEQSK